MLAGVFEIDAPWLVRMEQDWHGKVEARRYGDGRLSAMFIGVNSLKPQFSSGSG